MWLKRRLPFLHSADDVKSSKRGTLCSVLALALLLGATTALALENETLNWWELADCPSEVIELEGRVRFQTQLVEGADRSTYIFQAFWTGAGWGHDSGADYRIQGKWMEVVQENPPFVLRLNHHFQLVGRGDAPDYRLYGRVRVVVDAQGNAVFEYVNEQWTCPAIDFAIW